MHRVGGRWAEAWVVPSPWTAATAIPGPRAENPCAAHVPAERVGRAYPPCCPSRKDRPTAIRASALSPLGMREDQLLERLGERFAMRPSRAGAFPALQPAPSQGGR